MALCKLNDTPGSGLLASQEPGVMSRMTSVRYVVHFEMPIDHILIQLRQVDYGSVLCRVSSKGTGGTPRHALTGRQPQLGCRLTPCYTGLSVTFLSCMVEVKSGVRYWMGVPVIPYRTPSHGLLSVVSCGHDWSNPQPGKLIDRIVVKCFLAGPAPL